MYEITPSKKFFVGIDSDGCAFDTMELKHKECFIPQYINYYELQGVSKYAREASEFINLYSVGRGCNRFIGLIDQLDALRVRPEVLARGVTVPRPRGVIDWIKRETKLGNPALIAEVEKTNDPDLKLALEWSIEVNKVVGNIVRGVPPYPMVRESLQKLDDHADMLVVSATPNEALEREWAEHDLAKFVEAICGQEAGSKKETLVNAAKYEAGCRLMIGDAPGDHRAAEANDCLFYPINPGKEEASWQRFHDEGVERFLNGDFAGEFQDKIIAEFQTYLPEKPSWPVVE